MNCNAYSGTPRPQRNAYMTPDDFKRCFAARRRVSERTEAATQPGRFDAESDGDRASGTALSPVPRRPAAKQKEAKNSAAPTTCAGASRSAGYAGNFGRTGKLAVALEKKLGGKDIIKKTVRLTDEWLAVDPKENRAEGAHKKIPCHIMLMILALSLSLLLIVSGSVLTSKAEMEMRAVKNQLGELVEYKEELEQKLEIKNDLRYIETVARTRLGMIDKSYAPLKYLGEELEEKVVIYDTGTDSHRIGLSTLLNALGFPD